MPTHLKYAGYNQRIRNMYLYVASRWRGKWLVCCLLSVICVASSNASVFGDAARQFAQKISAATGPGVLAVQLENRSSLDEKSVREVRTALETQLRLDGVRNVKPDQAAGTIQITLSESLGQYVWAAEIAMGSDEKRVVLQSLPRPQLGVPAPVGMPVTLRKVFLMQQKQPILDAALIDVVGGARLFVLEPSRVAAYRQQGGRWDPEISMEISHSRTFPRDLRGHILPRRDHLFDVYLPGTFCRSGSTVPLTVNCADTDDPWPLTSDDSSVRAFFAPARNFFTGALSGKVGQLSNLPSFYSATILLHSGYQLLVLAAVDGSVHLVDGMTDQVLRGLRWGSDLAAVRSSCGTGNQVLAAEPGDSDTDRLRAFEIPDRDPVPVSAAMDFDGRVVALWANQADGTAIAVIKQPDADLYEAYRIVISCGS